MARLSRRGFVGVVASFGLGALVGGRAGLPRAFAPGRPRPITGAARELVAKAFEGLDRANIWDSHVHIVGLGTGDSGCWVNPKMQSVLHPWRQFQFDVYTAAAGVEDASKADQQYVERLLELWKLTNPAGKMVCLAFDLVVREDGNEDREASEMYTPNEYVLSLAHTHPEIAACVSIHPYRRDAVDRLDAAVAGGAVAVKWLPNAMGIDPANAKCDPFYRRLADHAIPLISHGGEEQAVHSDDWQGLGNPLRLRRALDAGVKVVIAHCASLGDVRDLDDPTDRRMSAFDAFMRLFTNSKWEKNLFADISALTQVGRSGRPLRDMLVSRDLHSRLVYGSDYPLPAIDPIISTRMLASDGYLHQDDRTLLNEIYAANPLLFDFVLKRRLSVEYKSSGYGFSPKVFESAWLFQRPPAG